MCAETGLRPRAQNYRGRGNQTRPWRRVLRTLREGTGRMKPRRAVIGTQERFLGDEKKAPLKFKMPKTQGRHWVRQKSPRRQEATVLCLLLKTTYRLVESIVSLSGTWSGCCDCYCNGDSCHILNRAEYSKPMVIPWWLVGLQRSFIWPKRTFFFFKQLTEI